MGGAALAFCDRLVACANQKNNTPPGKAVHGGEQCLIGIGLPQKIVVILGFLFQLSRGI